MPDTPAGVCYAHWSKKAVQDELNRIADEIHSQYEIAYVPHAPSDHGFHRIEVHVDRNGVKVRTKAGYFLGGQQFLRHLRRAAVRFLQE